MRSDIFTMGLIDFLHESLVGSLGSGSVFHGLYTNSGNITHTVHGNIRCLPTCTLPETNIAPVKWMVGRETIFAGAMLVLGRVMAGFLW